jgi:mono/diheme cytochrome c family protein
MLRGVDTALELLGWSLAVFFVIMLFAGPHVIAEDKPATKAAKPAAGAPAASAPAEKVDGKAVFSDNCGSCHTLSAAGTSGTVGPNLDDVSLDAGAVEDKVRNGGGTMPAFGDKLSDDEVTAVAEFVAGN